jgi:glycerol-3-phosphate dehydrogenase
VSYLLQAVDSSFPDNKITPEKIISTFSGVRPVIASDKDFTKRASKERRDHAVWANKGLITASGGKLTTFRLTAIEALDAAKPWLMKRIKTNVQRINDRVFSNDSFDQVFNNIFLEDKNNSAWLERLLGRYGNYASLILEQTDVKEQQTIGNTKFCLAECRWAIKNEGVVHLDDLLLRRTRLGLLLNNGAEELLDKLSSIFQQELGWHQTKWQDEVKRYQSIWQRFYYLPTSIKNDIKK